MSWISWIAQKLGLQWAESENERILRRVKQVHSAFETDHTDIQIIIAHLNEQGVLTPALSRVFPHFKQEIRDTERLIPLAIQELEDSLRRLDRNCAGDPRLEEVHRILDIHIADLQRKLEDYRELEEAFRKADASGGRGDVIEVKTEVVISDDV